jgi:hypothetical protein
MATITQHSEQLIPSSNFQRANYELETEPDEGFPKVNMTILRSPGYQRNHRPVEEAVTTKGSTAKLIHTSVKADAPIKTGSTLGTALLEEICHRGP